MRYTRVNPASLILLLLTYTIVTSCSFAILYQTQFCRMSTIYERIEVNWGTADGGQQTAHKILGPYQTFHAQVEEVNSENEVLTHPPHPLIHLELVLIATSQLICNSIFIARMWLTLPWFCLYTNTVKWVHTVMHTSSRKYYLQQEGSYQVIMSTLEMLMMSQMKLLEQVYTGIVLRLAMQRES